jgi:hypothetical protein
MESLPAEDLFAADRLFATSLGSMYGSEFSTGTDFSIAPFGPESEDTLGGLPATNFNTGALLAMFDCSLADFFEIYPSINDVNVGDLTDKAGGSDDIPFGDSLVPDYQFLDLPAAGTMLNDSERNENSNFLLQSRISIFEGSNSTLDSEFSKRLFVPRMTDAELGHPAMELQEQSVLEKLRFDRRPSQDSEWKGTISKEHEPKVSSIREQRI